MTSTTQRALADLREMGFLAWIAEHWNHFAKIRQDAFGFADIIAIDKFGRILFVQVTSDAHVAERRAKVERNDAALRIAGGPHGDVEVWGYGKKGARGKRKTWELQRWQLVWSPAEEQHTWLRLEEAVNAGSPGQ